ncbi:EI24 domain-containing protein [Campylobacter sp. RM13119]|uniref:EI24 domain-containing protein n=1 Tax=Campylobacter californiensis TaxID=1032243 RepID=UPI001473DB75|nr:EI24 domain-containing protein [Campylobacter sp. RM13119]MBE3606391.1 EI24 domain-containing protein [Campylobacter sp. RM13119]
MLENFRLSYKDFLTKKFITLSILPLVCSVCLLGVGLFIAGSSLGENFMQMSQSGDFGYFNLSKYPLVMQILTNEITTFILSAAFYALGTYVTLVLSVIVALVIAGFLTTVVTNEINKRHYNLEFKPVSTVFTLRLTAKVIVKFLALLIVCLPFIFVPFLHFFIINIPFLYLYHKLLLIDVGSNTLNETKFHIAWLDGGGIWFKLACGLFYLLSLVPLLGLFLQLFFIIFLSHLLFQKQAVSKF